MWGRASDDTIPIFMRDRPPLSERLWAKRWWFLSTAVTLACSALAVGMFALRMSRSGHPVGLPVDELASMWDNSTSWNVTNYIYGSEYCSYSDGSLLVRYPQGSYQNTGGFKFYSQPPGFPAREACFSYEVYFPGGFPWTKGGKLPGMYIGDWGANGGNHIDSGYSARFMWRAGGAAEVYLYVPTGQLPEYYSSVTSNLDYGESLWRGRLVLAEGSWNSMRMCIGLNSPGAHDGTLSATINNVTLVYNSMQWTPGPMPISGLMMNTFFGGNDPSWAAPEDTYARFRAFSAP